LRGFLLDTNILSELRRPRPEPNVLALLAAQPEEHLFVSEVTMAEIRFGIERAPDPERRAALATWLTHDLRPLFAGRALPLTEDVILRWRLLLDAGRWRGHTFGPIDLFIAATAAEAELVVVSRDITHFAAARTPHLDPWSGQYVSSTGEERVLTDLAAPDLLRQLSN
jgi:predicted nucleic acid-binding protein